MINRKELESWAEDAVYNAQNELRAMRLEGMDEFTIYTVINYVKEEVCDAYHRGVAEGAYLDD